MAVYDRWHKKTPGPGQEPCREHSRGKNRLYPSADHGKGMRWQVRYYDETGKQCKLNRPKKEGRNPDVHADALDIEIQAQLQAGTYIDPAAGQVTLETFALEWQAGLTSGLTTRQAVDDRLAHIIEGLGDKQMAALAKRPSVIQQFVKGLEAKGLSPGYIKNIARTLTTVFNAAQLDGIVVRNPVPSVTLPKIASAKAVPWTLAQVQAARASLPAEQAAMLDLGAGCGLRQGELFAIAAEDLAFLGREVAVRRQVKLVEWRGGWHLVFDLPKGGKERTVPLPDPVGLALSAHLADYGTSAVTLPWKQPDGKPHTAQLLFVPEPGQAWRSAAFNDQIWGPARAAAGVAPTRENGMHVLRHTSASAWLAAGVTINDVAAFLGHSDPGFTLRTYTHLMPSSAERARRAMALFFAGDGSDAPDMPSQKDSGL